MLQWKTDAAKCSNNNNKHKNNESLNVSASVVVVSSFLRLTLQINWPITITIVSYLLPFPYAFRRLLKKQPVDYNKDHKVNIRFFLLSLPFLLTNLSMSTRDCRQETISPRLRASEG